MWNVSAESRLFCIRRLLFILIVAFLGSLSKAQAAGLLCQNLFEPAIFQAKPDRLYDYYLNEIQFLSNEQVQKLNQELLQALDQYTPWPSGTRAQGISWKQAQKMVSLVGDHSVLGTRSEDMYLRPGEQMGYCFGRAMYLHLLALKLGVQKDSIKKIWAVGPMSSGVNGVLWGYHVGLLVYSHEGWLVLDANQLQVVKIENWVQKFSELSVDQRIRFYVTEAEKFGLYAGKYSRFLLGLDLSKEEDWFRHYFVDMLEATRRETLSELGLKKLTPKDDEPRAGLIRQIRNFFNF